MNEAPQFSVPSPCVRNCCLNKEDVCVGCLRTLEEILMWSAANDVERQQILNNCKARNKSN